MRAKAAPLARCFATWGYDALHSLRLCEARHVHHTPSDAHHHELREPRLQQARRRFVSTPPSPTRQGAPSNPGREAQADPAPGRVSGGPPVPAPGAASCLALARQLRKSRVNTPAAGTKPSLSPKRGQNAYALAMTESDRFYVVSMKTQEHKELAYIEFSKPNDNRPSTWRITKNPAKAHDFGSLALAREFQRQFKELGEANGLKNDGHIWHISDHV
jgi:hypothetical protein